MDKRDMALLEKCFAAEIDSAIGSGLPPLVQTKSKRMSKLETDGLVVQETVTLGGRFPIEITGWKLTPLGHLTYCMLCPDPELEGTDKTSG